MLVYVLNRHGQPLMPCSARKARLLLKQKEAVVVRREPFTIRLLYGSSGYKQEVTLGVDTGSRHIGMSATTKEKGLDLILKPVKMDKKQVKRVFGKEG